MKIESFNIAEYLETKTEISNCEKQISPLLNILTEKYKRVLSDCTRPDFLERAIKLQQETDDIIFELNILGEESRSHTKQENTIQFLKLSSARFFESLKKTYPFECILPAVDKRIKNFAVLNFKSTDDVMKHLLVVINKVFVLSKAGKLLQPRNPDFLNLDALINLVDNTSPIDDLWLNQFLHCLVVKEFEENSRLIRQTPPFMMEFAGKLFTELHGLSIDKIKKA